MSFTSAPTIAIGVTSAGVQFLVTTTIRIGYLEHVIAWWQQQTCCSTSCITVYSAVGVPLKLITSKSNAPKPLVVTCTVVVLAGHVGVVVTAKS
jgi:hypothetical protein